MLSPDQQVAIANELLDKERRQLETRRAMDQDRADMRVTYPDGRRRHPHRPYPIGLSITQAVVECDPVPDANGQLWATWEKDGPLKYWLDGQEITAEEYNQAIA